jgi:hypothetical protein
MPWRIYIKTLYPIFFSKHSALTCGLQGVAKSWKRKSHIAKQLHRTEQQQQQQQEEEQNEQNKTKKRSQAGCAPLRGPIAYPKRA